MMKKLITVLFMVASIWFPFMVCSAVNPEDVLPVDEAFQSSVEVRDDQIIVRFSIADDYYLYKHAFEVFGTGMQLDTEAVVIPAGKRKIDEFFGEVETYRKSLEILVPITQLTDSAELVYRYQGCADAGICYPPQRKTVKIDAPINNSPAISDNGLSLASEHKSNPFFQGAQSVLPESQAFLVEAIAMDEAMLSVRFTSKPDIYLYKDYIKFTSLTEAVSVQQIDFPKADMKDDPHFGLVPVFWHQVEIPVSIKRSSTINLMRLQVDFQGCVNDGICYPPMQRIIEVELSDYQPVQQNTADKTSRSPASTKNDSGLSEQQLLTQSIAENSWFSTMIKFFGIGLLLSLTPCVFPMIPILSGLIVGQNNLSTSRAFTLSLVYVLAMALTYTAAGVLAGLLGTNLQALFQKPWIVITFCGVFVVLALSMFGFFELQLPAKWQNKLSGISNRQKSGSLAGVAVMGLLSALIVGPCVTPALAAVVLYISSNNNGPLLGGLTLFSMAMGMGMILLVVGTSAGRWVPRSGGWMNVVKSLFGILLLALAVWFLSRIVDATIILFLWGVLALASGVMWYQHALANGIDGWLRWFLDFFRILLITIGVVYVVAALAGRSSPLQPLKGLFSGTGMTVDAEYANGVDFQKVVSLEDLKSRLNTANKPVLLDFYADWCVDCKRMEATTFMDAGVIERSKNFLVLKADVTAQSEQDRALMSEFGIIGPPATLFWSAKGEPLVQYNFFGYKSATELIQTFENVLK